VKTSQTEPTKCDSCNIPQCQNRVANEVCGNYKTEVTVESHPSKQGTYRFRCLVNGLTSEWWNRDEEANRPDGGIDIQTSAKTLHCPHKVLFFARLAYFESLRRIREEYGCNLTPEDVEELRSLSVNPCIEDFFLKEVHRTVSEHDDHVIRAVFYAGVSAYASPINLALKCESGSGKTYSTTQTIKFLPPENVQMIGSQSPKVISHENGVLLDKNGVPIPEESPQKPRRTENMTDDEYNCAVDDYYKKSAEYRERLKNSYYQVDLHNKILVFLEGVNVETFKMLKSTLSHDNETIDPQIR
jgi:hypothetical protein